MTDSKVAQRLCQIAWALLERSRQGDITWKEENPTAFFTKLGDNYFQVESEDEDGNHPYKIQIEEPSPSPAGPGTRVLAFISTRDDYDGLLDGWKVMIEDLYGEASKRGSSAERALVDMLERVEGKKPIDEDDIPF